jgi:precorrin-6A synthase
MKKIYVIGIGAGNPEFITVQAIKALNQVDVFFFMDKGELKQDLVALRKEVCERYIEDQTYRIVERPDPVRDPEIADYKLRVELWHQQRALIYEEIIAGELQDDQSGAFLVWGDPSLYDSTLRILDRVVARGQVSFELFVIPGITSMQALAASHQISLNGLGESVVITTGRRLSSGLAPLADRTVVMLDGQCSFNSRTDEDLDIYWAAYLGMDHEVIRSGKLSEVAAEIEAVREQNRARHGWIMDIYLLANSAKTLHRDRPSPKDEPTSIPAPSRK